MSLTAHIPPTSTPTGLVGDSFRPITEGKKVVAVQEQSRFDGLFGALDDLGSAAVGGVSKVVKSLADDKASRINGGVETTVTSEGDPNANIASFADKSTSFLTENKNQLMLAGGVIAGVLGIYFLTRGK